MDPMDFTMESDAASQQQQQPSYQFQCQTQQTPANPPHQHAQIQAQAGAGADGGAGTSQAFRATREQRYDPVHDSSSWWYQSNQVSHSATQSNPPPFTPPPQPIPHMLYPIHGTHPPIHNWQGFGDAPPGLPIPVPDPSSMYNRAPPPQQFLFGPSYLTHARTGEAATFNNGGTQYHTGAVNNSNTFAEQLERERISLHRQAFEAQAAAGNRPFIASTSSYARFSDNLDSLRSSTELPPPSRRHGAVTANESSAGETAPSSRASMFAHRSYYRPDRNSEEQARIQRRLREVSSANRRRAYGTWSSDDDDFDPETDSTQGRYREALMWAHNEEHVLAAMRGALSTGKKVPSKEALASLISMTVDEVKAEGEDINCMICYNDCGTPNPEGVIETPLRLPKCKHIFGSVCIKKWFEDSDTCPYCRDKLPSVRISSASSFRNSTALQIIHASRLQQQQEREMRRLQMTGTTAPEPESVTDDSRARFERGMESILSRSEATLRATTGDSPDRRRQPRGRVPTGARPTHGYQRHNPARAEALHTPLGYAQLLELQRNVSSPPIIPPGLVATPPLNSNGSPSLSRPAEAASPAVAVGSFINPHSNRQDASQVLSTSSWPQSTLPTDEPQTRPTRFGYAYGNRRTHQQSDSLSSSSSTGSTYC